MGTSSSFNDFLLVHFIRTAPLQLGMEEYLSDKLIFRDFIHRVYYFEQEMTY